MLEFLTKKPPIEAENENLFEKQLKEKHTMDVGGTPVEYVRLCPPLEKQVTQVPVIVAPGLTENPKLLKKLLNKLYDDGGIVFSLEHNHDIHVESDGHPQAQEKKIATIVALMEEARSINPKQPDKKVKPHGTVDLIGRSDGGINSTFAAARHPEYVDNLILLDTKHTPKSNAIPLYVHFVEHTLHEGPAALHVRDNEHITDGVRQAISYVGPHVIECIQEINAIAQSDIRDALKYLRRQKVKVYAIHGTSDDIFPIDEAQKAIYSELYDGFYTVGPTNKLSEEDEKRLPYTPDYTPINHASTYKNEKYIKLISHVRSAARKRSDSTAPLSQ